KDSLILYSFAGSGTTGHAVLKQNAEDGGNRRFILVEMDENIAQNVTRERVRRVAEGYTNAKGQAVEGLGGGFQFCRLSAEPLFDADGQIRRDVTFAQLAEFVWFAETGSGYSPSPQPSPIEGEGASSPSPHPSPIKAEGAIAPSPFMGEGWEGGANFTPSPQPSPIEGEGARSPSPQPAPVEGEGASIAALLEGEGAGLPSPLVGEGPGVGAQARSPLLGVHEGRAIYLLYNGILKDKSVGGGNVLTGPVFDVLPKFAGPKVIYAAANRMGARATREGITFKQTPYALEI
ncbi:MAG: hypothetical protein RBR56_05375, partial [Halothiobacillus sp.]|nr:hypothetical protein [Halothiobacillus sp.]